jgi:hypothetical protein
MAKLELTFGAKATPMLRVTALLWVLIALQSAAMAEEAKQDTIDVHGKSLQLSCAEWKRNSDGSWTSIGALLVGTDTLNHVTLRGAETKILDEKCQNATNSSAASSQTPPQHKTHRHGSTAPAGGT